MRARKMPETLFGTAPNAARASACAIACAVLHNTARTLSAETLLSRSPSCPCSVSISGAVLLRFSDNLLRAPTRQSTRRPQRPRDGQQRPRLVAGAGEEIMYMDMALAPCSHAQVENVHLPTAHVLLPPACKAASCARLRCCTYIAVTACVGEDVARVATHVEHRLQGPYASLHAWGTCVIATSCMGVGVGTGALAHIKLESHAPIPVASLL